MLAKCTSLPMLYLVAKPALCLFLMCLRPLSATRRKSAVRVLLQLEAQLHLSPLLEQQPVEPVTLRASSEKKLPLPPRRLKRQDHPVKLLLLPLLLASSKELRSPRPALQAELLLPPLWLASSKELKSPRPALQAELLLLPLLLASNKELKSPRPALQAELLLPPLLLASSKELRSPRPALQAELPPQSPALLLEMRRRKLVVSLLVQLPAQLVKAQMCQLQLLEPPPLLTQMLEPPPLLTH